MKTVVIVAMITIGMIAIVSNLSQNPIYLRVNDDIVIIPKTAVDSIHVDEYSITIYRKDTTSYYQLKPFVIRRLKDIESDDVITLPSDTARMWWYSDSTIPDESITSYK